MNWWISLTRLRRFHAVTMHNGPSTFRLTKEQINFLNEVFDKGERTSSKATPEATLALMKEQFAVKDYLPTTTIKSYFSRRARKIRLGEVIVGEKEDGIDELIIEEIESEGLFIEFVNFPICIIN